jgi:secreted trypsin-like serine protease
MANFVTALNSRAISATVAIGYLFCCALPGRAQDAPSRPARGEADAQCMYRPGEKIINGVPALAQNWPGIASLRLHNPQTKESLHFCGGTVVAPTWVLTAAHCVNSLQALRKSFFPQAPADFKLQVVLGSDDLENAKPEAVFDVDEAGIRIPEQYKIAVEKARLERDEAAEVYAQGDIALVELKRPYSGRLAPLPGTDTSDNPEAQDELLVAGFGATDPSGADLRKVIRADTGERLQVSSPRLLEAPLAAVSRQGCREAFPEASISDHQLCAGTASTAKPTDSCSGDSGGPLVAITRTQRCIVQIGVVSFGPRLCATQTLPAVYTRVSAYRGWISDSMRPRTGHANDRR